MGTDCHTGLKCGGTVQVQIATPDILLIGFNILLVGQEKFGGLARGRANQQMQ